jgi:PEP-CTERM motif-containing protein
MRIPGVLLALTIVTGCLHVLPAASIVTFDRATFQAALGSAGLLSQDFDALPAGTITIVNGVTYTPSGGTAVVTSAFLTSTSPNGLGSTSSGFFQPTETLTILFSSPITAFALDINTFATKSGDYQAAVNDGSASVIPSVLDVFPNTETGQFIGFTDSSSFNQVVISGVPDPGTGAGFCGENGLCSYTVDTLVYGESSAVTGVPGVPEPSTLVLLGLGICAIGMVGRRRVP